MLHFSKYQPEEYRRFDDARQHREKDNIFSYKAFVEAPGAPRTAYNIDFDAGMARLFDAARTDLTSSRISVERALRSGLGGSCGVASSGSLAAGTRVASASVVQGPFGNCYAYAALQSFASLGWLEEIEPATDGLGRLYRVRLFVYGVWRDVIVDDRIPYPFFEEVCGCLYDGPSYSSVTVMLLIKALAKLIGDYSMLPGGIMPSTASLYVGWTEPSAVFVSVWRWDSMPLGDQHPWQHFISGNGPSVRFVKYSAAPASQTDQAIAPKEKPTHAFLDLPKSRPEWQLWDPRQCRLWVSPEEQVLWLALKHLRQRWQRTYGKTLLWQPIDEKKAGDFFAGVEDDPSCDFFDPATRLAIGVALPEAGNGPELVAVRVVLGDCNRRLTTPVPLGLLLLLLLERRFDPRSITYGVKMDATELLRRAHSNSPYDGRGAFRLSLLEGSKITAKHQSTSGEPRKCAFFRMRSRLERLDKKSGLEQRGSYSSWDKVRQESQFKASRAVSFTIISRLRSSPILAGMLSFHAYSLLAFEVFAVPLIASLQHQRAHERPRRKFLLIYSAKMRNPHHSVLEGRWNAFAWPEGVTESPPKREPRMSDVLLDGSLNVRVSFPCLTWFASEAGGAASNYQCSTGDVILHSLNSPYSDMLAESERERAPRFYDEESMALRDVLVDANSELGLYHVRMDCDARLSEMPQAPQEVTVSDGKSICVEMQGAFGPRSVPGAAKGSDFLECNEGDILLVVREAGRWSMAEHLQGPLKYAQGWIPRNFYNELPD
ncbi:unnamed protein product [Amoebophrya sp. A25]|nr:unnamed protein product [Amoebophrya sp. A25]|eukprot:GSA25T00024688001.1